MLSQAALLGIAGSSALVLRAGGVEVIREGSSDVLRIDVSFLACCGNGITTRPTFTEIAEDVVGKDGCGEIAAKECLLHSGIDVKFMGIVVEAVVVAGGIVQIEHGLRGLVDGEPVAEIYLPFGFVKFRSDTVCLSIEALLPITKCQCGTIEAKLGRGCQRGAVTLKLVEVTVSPNGNLRSLLIQTAKVQTHVLIVAVSCREGQPLVSDIQVEVLLDGRT